MVISKVSDVSLISLLIDLILEAKRPGVHAGQRKGKLLKNTVASKSKSRQAVSGGHDEVSGGHNGPSATSSSLSPMTSVSPSNNVLSSDGVRGGIDEEYNEWLRLRSDGHQRHCLSQQKRWRYQNRCYYYCVVPPECCVQDTVGRT